MFFLFLFLGQCVFAVIAVFVLKNFLDKELMNAALEEFESVKNSAEIKEIHVKFASTMPRDEFKNHIESLRRRKFSQAVLSFQEDGTIKGGVVITLGDLLLDFSLSSRLKNFWL